MFREMRRKNQALSDNQCIEILQKGSHGVLACHGDDGYPYAVPLNYAYKNSCIYVHCAKQGHKLDAILKDPKVSFTVVGKDMIVANEYTSYFSSVIVFGKARIVDGNQSREAFMTLVDKYCSTQKQEENESAIADCKQALILAIEIEHLSGKSAKELIVSS